MAQENNKPRWYRGKVADMLRASGYVPLPRMWVRKEQMEQIMAICKENEAHVNNVRRYCRELEENEGSAEPQKGAQE